MLTIPYRVLFPAIIVFACIGCYSIASNVFDIYAIAVFGVVGYVLIKLGCEPAPLLLGFVLGPLLEEHLRRAMIISRGDPMIFLGARSRPRCSRSPRSLSSPAARDPHASATRSSSRKTDTLRSSLGRPVEEHQVGPAPERRSSRGEPAA